MDLLKYNEAKETWQEIAQGAEEANIPYSFELEIYKKLLSRFHLGSYYYYIFNVGTIEMEFVSNEVESVMGWDKSVFSVEYVMANIHPKDRAHFILYEQEVTSFFAKLSPEEVLKYKVSYDYRVRGKDGVYKWILQQVTTIQTNEKGAVIRVLGVHTDITHLKTEDKPADLSFIGLEGAPSYFKVLSANGKRSVASRSLFSSREREVIKLALAGNSTVEIASLLHLSHHTISVHRKRILRKSDCKTFVELGTKALREGWV